MSDITVVTAFFDIGRGNLPNEKHGRVLPHYQHRSVDTYFEYFSNLAKLENEMVIYTSTDLVERVSKVREDAGYGHLTKVVALPSYLPESFESTKIRIQEIMDNPEYYEKVLNPQLIEYWHVDYVLVNILKSMYVSHAVDTGLVSNDLTSWIDFGYCRDENTIPEPKRWTYPFNTDKIHFFNMADVNVDRTINDIIYTGDVYIQGCHIVAGSKMWTKLYELVCKNLGTLINNGLIDDDQTLLFMSYLTEPESFELRYNSPNDWFRIFKDYNHG